MAAKIIGVDKGSPAERAGVRIGDTLLKIDEHEIKDVLDYKFYGYEERTVFTILTESGEQKQVTVRKYEGQDAGLTFETYLMDKAKHCANKCIFCFIDQLPKNMRSTLYFKDDDSRMSFLMGNYISLTNLSEQDVQRIVKMRISPINVSVQTTNPELRNLMLGNKRAGESLKIMQRFKDAGIKMNCQLVICPGVNDGEELHRSLRDLTSMYPEVANISVVPAGITKYREGLYPLKPTDKRIATEIIDIAEHWAKQCIEKFGETVVYASDELYIKAEKTLPPYEYYGDFVQLENGIGMMRLMEHEFKTALDFEDDKLSIKPFTVITGMAAKDFINGLACLLKEKCPDVKFNVYGIPNKFFGENITVAGLVTATDILDYLKDKPVYDRIFIPKCMLKHGEDVFLDDIHVSEVEQKLNAKITTTGDGGEFLDAILENEI